ncbi:MAG: hypothetical protein LBH43_11525 [Treponema sp.]|jgi:hypothetical protein|nr:hypothetical protein [Treponema sp.]
MDEKKFNWGLFAVFCFLLGAACAGIVARYIAFGRSAGEVAGLDARHNQLDREYSERQRVIESNVAECLGFVESARGIAERTGESAGGAIGNLQEAVALVRQGIAEREALKVELDNIRAGLHRIGDMAGLGLE